ncbi:MAG: hypothetical protein WDA68_01015 [Phycisphaerae bacterium]
MNRAQKNALAALVFLSSTSTIFAYVFFQIFILKKTPVSFAGRLLPLIVLILVNVPLSIWVFRRQSSGEVAADERDKLIDNRAAMAAFVSALIVFLGVSGIPRLILGDNGCIPVWSLPLINFGAFIIVAMVYFAAILVQYFSGRGNGKS